MPATPVPFDRARLRVAGGAARAIHRAIIVLVALSVLLTVVPLSHASASHLFAGAAGWSKARGSSSRSIRVWSEPSLGVNVKASIAPWNWMAGWRLFRQARSRQSADVLFLPSPTAVNWTECPPTYFEPFHLCTIWIEDPSIEMSRHELGHALGFADHIDAARYEEGKHVRARVCDRPDHAQFSSYHGVMSYCDWSDDLRGWFGPRDQKMMARAGYASSARVAFSH
jgi:hypothetical protein